jgi:hypothetical protein
MSRRDLSQASFVDEIGERDTERGAMDFRTESSRRSTGERPRLCATTESLRPGSSAARSAARPLSPMLSKRSSSNCGYAALTGAHVRRVPPFVALDPLREEPYRVSQPARGAPTSSAGDLHDRFRPATGRSGGQQA